MFLYAAKNPVALHLNFKIHPHPVNLDTWTPATFHRKAGEIKAGYSSRSGTFWRRNMQDRNSILRHIKFLTSLPSKYCRGLYISLPEVSLPMVDSGTENVLFWNGKHINVSLLEYCYDFRICYRANFGVMSHKM